jgi:hypothetical protein
MAEGEEADFFHGVHGAKADVSRLALSNPKLGLEQAAKAVPVRMDADDWHGFSCVIAGLDPAIHLLFAKTLLRSGWTRGSSPRVTPEKVQSQYEREPL